MIALCGLLAAAGVIAASLLVTTGAVHLPGSGERLSGVTTSVSDEASESKSAVSTAVAPTAASLGSVATLSPTTSVYVSQATGFVPGRRATGATQAQALVFTVTVTNTGTDAASPSIVIGAASGSTAATPIADATNGLRVGVGGLSLEGGESRTYRVAFSAASSEATVTVSSAGRTVSFS